MNVKKEVKKESMGEFMKRYNAVFSINTRSGFTNVCFEKDYKENIQMVVKFFDDEGRPLTDEDGDGGVPIEEVIKAAQFVKEIKEMQLENFTKEVK